MTAPMTTPMTTPVLGTTRPATVTPAFGGPLVQPPRTAVAAGPGRPEGRTLDPLRFCTGAGLTAAIAVVVGVLGLVVAGGIAHVPVAVPTPTYGLLAAAVALVAAGLYGAMLLAAPRPTVYFGWLMTGLTLLATVLPFAGAAPLAPAIVLAGVNLVVGLVIVCLVPLAADSSSRR